MAAWTSSGGLLGLVRGRFGDVELTGLVHYRLFLFTQARSSVGERFLDTEEVGSSILPVPTIF